LDMGRSVNVLHEPVNHASIEDAVYFSLSIQRNEFLRRRRASKQKVRKPEECVIRACCLQSEQNNGGF
jgi:hypothetical protein